MAVEREHASSFLHRDLLDRDQSVAVVAVRIFAQPDGAVECVAKLSLDLVLLLVQCSAVGHGEQVVHKHKQVCVFAVVWVVQLLGLWLAERV